MSGCIERIWDNGDMTHCGAPIVHVARCQRHLEERRLRLLDLIEGYRREAMQCETLLAELDATTDEQSIEGEKKA